MVAVKLDRIEARRVVVDIILVLVVVHGGGDRIHLYVLHDLILILERDPGCGVRGRGIGAGRGELRDILELRRAGTELIRLVHGPRRNERKLIWGAILVRVRKVRLCHFLVGAFAHGFLVVEGRGEQSVGLVLDGDKLVRCGIALAGDISSGAVTAL